MSEIASGGRTSAIPTPVFIAEIAVEELRLHGTRCGVRGVITIKAGPAVQNARYFTFHRGEETRIRSLPARMTRNRPSVAADHHSV